MSPMDGYSWESEDERPWETTGSGGWEAPDPEAWRGDIHVNDWPENLAGPEYWLYKQDNDDD